MKKQLALKPFHHDRARSKLFSTHNAEPSLTQQSDLNDSDINVLMARHAVTGQIPQLIQQGQYGDFTEITDYRQAQDAILAANQAFADVPAKLRERFDNDPAKFFDFVNDPDNLPEMRKLGLAQAEEIDNTPPPALSPQEEYDDDGTRTRSTNEPGARRSGEPRRADEGPGNRQAPLRQSEGLHPNGNREPLRGDPSGKGR